MILGNGDIASALIDRGDLLFFACGVSNSAETREAEYRRDVDFLLTQDKDQHIVYFGTLAIFYSNTRYVQHKKYMESLVKGFRRYTIIRLGNITWGTNPHTLINFFKERYARGEKLDIQDTYRYICDREEFDFWVDKIPEFSCEMNVPGKRMKVQDIVNQYVYDLDNNT